MRERGSTSPEAGGSEAWRWDRVAGEGAGARGGEEEAECQRGVFAPATCAILRAGEGLPPET